jgi:uncharacterized protein
MVAIVSRTDSNHERCMTELAEVQPPLITCWPVVTEALWMVRQDAIAVRGLFRGFADGLWSLLPIGIEAFGWLESFLNRYRKLGAQIADACLVYLAEREGLDTVFTLDYRDFSVYRFKKNRSFNLIPRPP